MRHIGRPFILVWDRLPVHRSGPMRDYLDSLQGRIQVECARLESSRIYLGLLEAARAAQRLSERELLDRPDRAILQRILNAELSSIEG